MYNLLIHAGPPCLFSEADLCACHTLVTLMCECIFPEASGIMIRLPLRRSWPRTRSSSAKALYLVPDKWLQSPEVTAWCINYNVGFFADACTICWGVSAAYTASLAILKAYSVLSCASSWAGSTGSRLRASAEFSFSEVSLDTEIARGITTIFQYLLMGVYSWHPERLPTACGLCGAQTRFHTSGGRIFDRPNGRLAPLSRTKSAFSPHYLACGWHSTLGCMNHPLVVVLGLLQCQQVRLLWQDGS